MPFLFLRTDENSTDEACLRVGNVDDETEDNLVSFGCGANEYNPSASLFVPSGEHIVKSLFSRGCDPYVVC